MNEEDYKLVVFQRKDIRRRLHGGEWWFVIADVIVALTDSKDPAQYLRKMRARDPEIAEFFDPVDKGESQFATPPGAGPKGGYKLYRPLNYPLKLQVVSKNCFLGTLRVFFGLFSLSQAKKPNRSSAGWHAWAMNG